MLELKAYEIFITEEANARNQSFLRSFNDHNPPHFKVKYGEFEANVLIENGTILNGDLPISKHKLVAAWCEIHEEELLDMWNKKEFHKINPLM